MKKKRSKHDNYSKKQHIEGNRSLPRCYYWK